MIKFVYISLILLVVSIQVVENSVHTLKKFDSSNEYNYLDAGGNFQDGFINKARRTLPLQNRLLRKTPLNKTKNDLIAETEENLQMSNITKISNEMKVFRAAEPGKMEASMRGWIGGLVSFIFKNTIAVVIKMIHSVFNIILGWITNKLEYLDKRFSSITSPIKFIIRIIRFSINTMTWIKNAIFASIAYPEKIIINLIVLPFRVINYVFSLFGDYVSRTWGDSMLHKILLLIIDVYNFSKYVNNPAFLVALIGIIIVLSISAVLLICSILTCGICSPISKK